MYHFLMQIPCWCFHKDSFETASSLDTKEAESHGKKFVLLELTCLPTPCRADQQSDSMGTNLEIALPLWINVH